MSKAILGRIINPLSDTECEFFAKGLILTKKTNDGEVIDFLGEQHTQNFSQTNYEIIDHGDDIILPGFYDMHFHWVQEDVCQAPKANLLEWLEQFTWPAEAKFADIEYSEAKAQTFFAQLPSQGTIGGAIYSSIHGHTVDHAFKYAKGDFVIGNVLMTMNSPDYLQQSQEQAKALIQDLGQRYGERYAVTPRFAPTTHPEVMKFADSQADKRAHFKQTHLSETKDEIEYVLQLFRKLEGFADVKTYTDIYHRCGLLGQKSIMGHAIHLSDQELQLLSKTQTAIAHCPTSNAPVELNGLGSGLFDFQKALDHNIRWALATDIGAGPYQCMLDVMQSFVMQNSHRSQATYMMALYRSSLAGAEILGIEDLNGNFAKDKFVNYIALSNEDMETLIPEDLLKNLLGQFVNKRDQYQSLIKKCVYRGQCLYER